MNDGLRIGLPAQLRDDCRVLILGSMPGAQSLQEQRYYAHPRNRFWPVMQAVFGVDATLPYPLRLAGLNAAGVGLWDVLAQCRRTGSLDAAIVRGTEVVNPLADVIGALPALQVVGCNGAAAATAFKRWVAPHLPQSRSVPVMTLPSTSPANAGWSLSRLVEAWQILSW